MAVDGVSPALAIRSSVGIELWASSGPKLPYEHKEFLPREETKNARSISFSPDGRYFAFSNGTEVKVLQSSDWGLKCTLPRPKAFYLKFSPRGNFLCTWELYTVTKDKPDGAPNMYVYEMETGNEVFSIVQKKQTDWEPSWSTDESIFAIIVGGEALFYNLGEGEKGFKSTSYKMGGSRNGVLSLGPGNSPPFLAFYTPGAKSEPSKCKLYRYSALSQTIACKSFFQADRVEMLWNKRGTGLLLLTSTEVDKSGASYYGNQALHFMATKGDSCSVPLSKEGPVHCVKWSPKATEFVVVYGFMPSKAAMYNLKCDVIFDFGEGPRNCAYFNPFGNLLVLAGFGNLPGNVEIWDVTMKEKIANIKCPDTTYFEWNPNGEYFVTATTAPRLRIGNGFKVYHYSGALMHETIWPQGQELLGVEWQKFSNDTFTEQPITKVKQEGIKSSQPEASKKAYTPPHLRFKNPEKHVPQPSIVPGTVPLGYTSQSNRKAMSKFNNQKPQKAKPKKEVNVTVDTTTDETTQSSTMVSNGETSSCENQQGALNNVKPPHFQNKKHQLATQSDAVIDSTQENGNDNEIGNSESQQEEHQPQQPKKVTNPEKEKKIRNVAKKLSDIKKLKARQSLGESLELNQLSKISMEAKFLEELKALKLSA